MAYESTIKADKEFREKVGKLFNYHENKTIKSTAEIALYKRLTDVKNYNNTSLPYIKERYNNMLPYFELVEVGSLWNPKKGKKLLTFYCILLTIIMITYSLTKKPCALLSRVFSSVRSRA